MKNTMMMLSVYALFLCTRAEAQATDTYKCITGSPRGEAFIKLKHLTNRTTRMHIQFKNKQLDETFTGILKMESNDVALIARGVLDEGRNNIKSSIQASFYEGGFSGLFYGWANEYVGADHRIHHGYGNPIQCSLIQKSM